MRNVSLLSLIAACAVAACGLAPALHAQANPCASQACHLVFDWGNGGAAPDVDKKYGSPMSLESLFAQTLSDGGWNASPTAAGPVTITVRLTPQTRALCDEMPGVNPDYTCHTVQRAMVLVQSNDSAFKSLPRVDVTPRCSDPKAVPTYAEFGRYAAAMVIFTLGNESKGQRPSIKCR